MSDPTQIPFADLTTCWQNHQQLNNSIIGMIDTLTYAQKVKVQDIIQKWITNNIK